MHRAASMLVVATAVLTSVAATTTSHHHHHHHNHRSSSSSRWEDATRHPLRHHGQDAPAAAPSGLDQLINRLDTMSGGGGYGYWRHRGEEDDDNKVALEELRQVVEDYERGEVLRPASTPSPANSKESAKRRHGEDDATLQEEDDEDDEDKDDTDEDDAEPDSDEADKAVSTEVEDMMDLDYRDSSNADMSQALLSDSPPPYSSYSEQKWKNYGTRESLAYTRRHGPGPEVQTTQRLAKEATEHMHRMMAVEGVCKVPKPVVVNVRQVYPDPSKEYLPHCTILHRCTDQTGCCRSARDTCKPKASATVKVVLPFYTTRVGHNKAIVETLTFYNETECECVSREDWSQPYSRSDPRSDRRSDPRGDPRNDPLPARKQRQTRTQLDMPSYIQVAPSTGSGCRCPSPFSPREVASPSGCTCDCFDRQTDCLKFKRGKAYFSLEDRLCIQTNECKLPSCESGVYMKLSGRCPRKDEKFSHYYYHHRRP